MFAGDVSLAHLTACPLDRRCRVVADTIDRKYRNVRAARETRQKRWVVFDAAIVVEEMAHRGANPKFGSVV
jgi:hypothetical protein